MMTPWTSHVAQALARLQAKLREARLQKWRRRRLRTSEAAIAAHGRRRRSLDAEEADGVKAAATDHGRRARGAAGARVERESAAAGKEARGGLDSPPKLALDLDRTALAARTEEALSSARGRAAAFRFGRRGPRRLLRICRSSGATARTRDVQPVAELARARGEPRAAPIVRVDPRGVVGRRR